jgi:hypothetical protein
MGYCAGLGGGTDVVAVSATVRKALSNSEIDDGSKRDRDFSRAGER